MSAYPLPLRENEIEDEIRLAFERIGVEVLGKRQATWYLRLPEMDDTIFQSASFINGSLTCRTGTINAA